MKWKGKTKLILIIGVMIFIQPIIMETNGLNITDFANNNSERIIGLYWPVIASEINFTIPINCYVINATMNVSGMHSKYNLSDYPFASFISIDNSTIWAFNGTGYGSLGLQNNFYSETDVLLNFTHGGEISTTSIRIPKNAIVKSASMNVDCGQDFRHSFIATYLGIRNQFLGYTVESNGDVNNDGYDDIIAGSGSLRYGTNRGPFNNSFVYLGGHKMNQTADYEMAFSNNSPNEFPVAYAGDINHDGFDDIIVGSPYESASAYIFFGGLKINDTPDIFLPCPFNSTFFGAPVAGIGDVNGDGYGDIIIGGTNGLNLYFGGTAINLTPDIILPGGSCVSGIGDFNKDGYTDFIVGNPNEDTILGLNTGTASIYFGGRSINQTPDIIIYGQSANEQFGWSISSAGDVNGDGFLDVIIGAPENKEHGDNSGAAYIFYGGTGINKSITLCGSGTSRFDYFGIAVSLAGDINRDGYDDVLVGASGDAGGGFYGYANIIFGCNNTSFLNILLKEGEKYHYDEFGESISGGGDIDADGYPDIVVSAPFNDENGGWNCGKIYIFNGSGIANVILDPKIEIRGKPIWKESGTVYGNHSIVNISDTINTIIESAPVSMIDVYGNSFVDIPINASVKNGRRIILNGLNITYGYNATIPDFAGLLNSYIFNHKNNTDINGNLTVNVQVMSQSEGEIKLSSLNITIDEPPKMLKQIPDVFVVEDTSNYSLINVQQFFYDDYDSAGDLMYSILSLKNGFYANITINSNKHLSVDLFNGSENDNWTGEIQLVVRAVDRAGLETKSNEFRLIVINVNDPPLIISNPVVTGLSGTEYTYQVIAVDGDNNLLTYTFDKQPENMTINVNNGSILWIPEKGGDYNISINVSDGIEYAYQNYTIQMIQSNRPPTILSIPLTQVVVGRIYRYNISAIDPDNDTLTYLLNRSPVSMTIDTKNGKIIWSPTKDQIGITNIEIFVNDGHGGMVKQQFNITIIKKTNPKPSYLITMDRSVPIFLVIIILAICLTVVLSRMIKYRNKK